MAQYGRPFSSTAKIAGKSARNCSGNRSMRMLQNRTRACVRDWLRPEGAGLHSPNPGPGPGTPSAPPSALHFISYANHALAGVAISCRAFGPANAHASQCLQKAQISRAWNTSRAQKLSACVFRLILGVGRPGFGIVSSSPSAVVNG
jgi:hypothetical protein